MTEWTSGKQSPTGAALASTSNSAAASEPDTALPDMSGSEHRLAAGSLYCKT